jgi:RHS repeat-associated protein
MTPVAEINSAGTILATNTFGADGLVSRNTTSAGATAGVGTSGSVFYVFDDHGNTTGRYAPGSGTQQLDFHLYDAWGGTVPTPASDGTPSTVDPWDGPGAHYGGYTDHETGLTLHGFRYYDPNRGRWVNRDPIGVDGGLDMYAYVLGNPVTGMDPLGTDTLLIVQGSGSGPFESLINEGYREASESEIQTAYAQGSNPWTGLYEGDFNVVELRQPTLKQFLTAAATADMIWYWGHGGGGNLELNDNGNNTSNFTMRHDFSTVVELRRRMHMGRQRGVREKY